MNKIRELAMIGKVQFVIGVAVVMAMLVGGELVVIRLRGNIIRGETIFAPSLLTSL